MKPNETQNTQLHKRLPIDAEEQILAIFHHHWFAYFSIWTVAVVMVVAIMGFTMLFLPQSQSASSGDIVSGTLQTHRTAILTGAGILSTLVLLFCAIPIWLRKQEQLVLTDEALLQILQPSLFASKISQLSLQHVADASVRRDFFGTLLGYGKITIETPGEQDNYEFVMVAAPENAVKQIITAHENYTSALESGRLPSTWRGETMAPGNPAAQAQNQAPAPIQLSAEEYQKFLDYQRSAQASQATMPAAATQPAAEPTPESFDQAQQ